MEPIWAAGACTAADVIRQLRDARLEPQHDPHAPGAARREGGAGLRRRRVAVHLPRRRLPPAMRAPGRPLVPGEGVRRRRRGAARALRRGIVARSRPDRATPSIARPEEESRGEADMITLLDTLGPAIWRASWQAAALAVLVVLLLRCFGERLSPRWRFLLWGVVLTRLLFVATPASPWSVFNLVPRNPEADARPIAHREADANAHAGSAQARLDGRPGRNERVNRRGLPTPRRDRPWRRRVRPRTMPSHSLRGRDGIDAVRERPVRCPVPRAGPVVGLAGRLSAAGVEAPGDRARPASAPFGLPPRDGCGRAGTPGRVPPPARTQAHSRIARDAGVPESLHRGDLEPQDRPAGIARDGVLAGAAPPRAGARAGASRARRPLDELAAARRRGSCTGSTPWPGGRSARCRPNARPPATRWRSPRWARPIAPRTPPRSSSSRRA